MNRLNETASRDVTIWFPHKEYIDESEINLLTGADALKIVMAVRCITKGCGDTPREYWNGYRREKE